VEQYAKVEILYNRVRQEGNFAGKNQAIIKGEQAIRNEENVRRPQLSSDQRQYNLSR